MLFFAVGFRCQFNVQLRLCKQQVFLRNHNILTFCYMCNDILISSGESTPEILILFLCKVNLNHLLYAGWL